jgi:hypothetical protein
MAEGIEKSVSFERLEDKARAAGILATFASEEGLAPAESRFLAAFAVSGYDASALKDLAKRNGVSPALQAVVEELEASGIDAAQLEDEAVKKLRSWYDAATIIASNSTIKERIAKYLVAKHEVRDIAMMIRNEFLAELGDSDPSAYIRYVADNGHVSGKFIDENLPPEQRVRDLAEEIRMIKSDPRLRYGVAAALIYFSEREIPVLASWLKKQIEESSGIGKDVQPSTSALEAFVLELRGGPPEAYERFLKENFADKDTAFAALREDVTKKRYIAAIFLKDFPTHRRAKNPYHGKFLEGKTKARYIDAMAKKVDARFHIDSTQALYYIFGNSERAAAFFDSEPLVDWSILEQGIRQDEGGGTP